VLGPSYHKLLPFLNAGGIRATQDNPLARWSQTTRLEALAYATTMCLDGREAEERTKIKRIQENPREDESEHIK